MNEQNTPSTDNSISPDVVQHRTILRLAKVLCNTGLSRSVLYELIANGEFPKQRQLTKKCVGWYSDEVQAFINSRPISE